MKKYYLESDQDSVAYPRMRRNIMRDNGSYSPYRNWDYINTIPRKLRLKHRLYDEEPDDILITDQLKNIQSEFEVNRWKKTICPGEIYNINRRGESACKTPLVRRLNAWFGTPEPICDRSWAPLSKTCKYCNCDNPDNSKQYNLEN
jgi:hypothetical protein